MNRTRVDLCLTSRAAPTLAAPAYANCNFVPGARAFHQSSARVRSARSQHPATSVDWRSRAKMMRRRAQCPEQYFPALIWTRCTSHIAQTICVRACNPRGATSNYVCVRARACVSVFAPDASAREKCKFHPSTIFHFVNHRNARQCVCVVRNFNNDADTHTDTAARRTTSLPPARPPYDNKVL